VIGLVGRGIAGVAAFLWDFVVGDDWMAAASIAVVLALGAALAHLARVDSWWLLPAGVAAVFGGSVRRAVRPARAVSPPR